MKNSFVLVEERRSRILDTLKREKSVAIPEISRELKVSEITIRRDLSFLEQSGLIVRYRGGASIVPNNRVPLSHFSDKLGINIEKKDMIGKRAAEMIAADDVVFVNSGTTVLSVLKHITRSNVRIITNNAMTPSIILDPRISIIITGGECNPESQSMYGDFATANIAKVYATKCILGVNGINASTGITTSRYQESNVNNMMLNRCSGKRIVVADSSKIGRSVDFLSAGIDMIDCLVTDAEANTAEIDRLRSVGVHVILVNTNDPPQQG